MSHQVLSVRETEALLRKASTAYYNNTPIMPDSEFDSLWNAHKAHRDLTPDDDMWKDTILDKVGAKPEPTSGFRKVKHATPMLSLDNVFVKEGGNIDELQAWLSRINVSCASDTLIVCEPKIDGLSASVVYAGGILQRVVTRGDGDEGDDITVNAVAAGLVPERISAGGTLEIRGEIYMPFAAFTLLNMRTAAAGDELYSNPRNAAAGIIRRKDPEGLRLSGLKFIAHGFETPTTDSYSLECEAWRALGIQSASSLKFLVFETVTMDMLKAMIPEAYPTDGLVFKLDSFRQREILGMTSRAPRWAIALKFEQPQVETPCRAITVQVGRSGILTPVAELEPVELDGTVVSRATLHNEAQVNRLGLAVGDTVVLQKAGGIIPEIVSVVGKHTKPRPEFNLLVHINHQCPECGSKDVEADGQRYVCRNTAGCKAQMAARIEHMASRGCLNILGLGTEACDAIAQRGDIQHPFDILNKSVEWFASLSWVTDTGKNMTFGKSRATKVASACIAARFLPLSRWITSLGIHSIGENTGKEISRLFESAHELMLINQNAAHGLDTDTVRISVIEAIAGGSSKDELRIAPFCVSNHLGPVSCNELLNFVNSEVGMELLQRIEAYGVKSDNYNPIPIMTATSAGSLAGKTFAITGTLSQPRDHFKGLIAEAGGKVTDTISAKLTALVCGEGGGGKRDKAAKAGVEVWDEERLMKELGQ